jgi:hypothetical protein
MRRTARACDHCSAQEVEMPSHTLPHVGDAVRLARSGHSVGSVERGTIVAVLGRPGAQTLRIRWTEHLETFVPANVAQVDQRGSRGSSS